MSFNLKTKLKPAGDQPQAIAKLTQNHKNGIDRQTLLGVTGSGKTFTIANLIQNTQLPTLVISHNKTLAGQLYQEFKELFPNNKVSYFVSYYDYYQPEAYIPASDTYIAKEVDINDLIDKLRLEATSNIFSGDDNIVIASVSCIYNIGDPTNFGDRVIDLTIGTNYPRRLFLEKLVSLFYQRSELEFKRGTFRVRGQTVEIWPSYQDWILKLTFENETLITIQHRHPMEGKIVDLTGFRLYPAKQYVGPQSFNLKGVFDKIRKDKQIQVDYFKSQNRLLEANRIDQKVEYDLEMIEELGYVNGIENYSIYFEDKRKTGDPPFTLIDYFIHRWGQNFLTIIDESHVTVSQIAGMHSGDTARKNSLIDFGFRLPSARDNRPLTFEEFNSKVNKIIYVSATPSPDNIKDSKAVVEQIIRPTGLVDPKISIRPTLNQIPDLITEITNRYKLGQRSLVLTLTKKMAEELSQYLGDVSKTKSNFRVAYLHSDIDTLERSDILDKLRDGQFDVLVGINLLREGLDLPEVSLVAILDAGQQGFLRSKTSLIQIMGRASRHIDGQVILYADTVSLAMSQAIKEVDRRRQLQIAFNKKHHITPISISKKIRPKIIEVKTDETNLLPKSSYLDKINPADFTPKQRLKYLKSLRQIMRQLAFDLDFEQAIKVRDQIKLIVNEQTKSHYH